jgi:RIO kinase 1
MHEYQALERLHLAGAIVPKPYQVGNNAILMEFIGEDNLAAPTLNSVGLDKDEAQRHFDLVMENVEIMLDQNLIHADLSAYNILYHAGEIVIIDLPQVINADGNRNAPAILARDVMRICEYFTKQGVLCDAREISQDLWRRYLRVPNNLLRADQSQLAERYPDIFGDPLG